MSRWLVRVEGVNFAETLFDTKDLSTVRGSSLALNALPSAIGEALAEFHAELVFEGASIGAFIITADGSEGELRAAVAGAVRKRIVVEPNIKGAPPLRHLSFVLDLAPLEGDERGVETALRQTEARNKTNQFRSWSFPPIDYNVGSHDADVLDRNRPGAIKIPNHGPISPSVHARRQYGLARNEFFERFVNRERPSGLGYRLSRSFEDMVESPPSGVSSSLRSKIAVFYADGNSFGDRRGKVGAATFGPTLRSLHLTLFDVIANWLRAGVLKSKMTYFLLVDHEAFLRFEPLLWGGDEMMFVMPAWLAFDFVSVFIEATKDWSLGGPLTHAMAIVIAHHKTPIRQLQRLAQESAELLKEAGHKSQSSVTFEIFESHAPPDTSVTDARLTTYAASRDGSSFSLDERLEGLLALPADEFHSVREILDRLQSNGTGSLPRSQLYAALRAARTQARGSGGASLLSEQAGSAASASLDGYARRAGRISFTPEQVRLPALANVERPLAVDLGMLSTLWDYASPFRGAVAHSGERR